MTIYAIGDIQGCFNSLQQLLKKIQFSTDKDILYFTGDLVNRGPDSMKVLQLVQSLKDNAVTVLGNHDLHMLAVLMGHEKPRPKDTLDDIINSTEKHRIIDWIRQQPLIHVDNKHSIALVHAGIYPAWTVPQAASYATEVEKMLQADNFMDFIRHMYGNEPKCWSENYVGWERLRFIVNCFTRMRYVDQSLNLELSYKGNIAGAKPEYSPWFYYGEQLRLPYKTVFGHWSTLGYLQQYSVYSLDTGCLWGGQLTALAITEEPYCIAVECRQGLTPFN